MSFTPSGTHITYYIICKRKLWLFTHHLSMEQESETVKIGKLIDDTTFERERKSRMIDGIINLDFIKGNQIIHEIKKSDALEEAHTWQIKYYLYYLKKKGLGVEKGVLHYPKQKIKKDVHLSEDDVTKLETILLPEIDAIVNSPKPPKKTKLPYCAKCSYYAFCYI